MLWNWAGSPSTTPSTRSSDPRDYKDPIGSKGDPHDALQSQRRCTPISSLAPLQVLKVWRLPLTSSIDISLAVSDFATLSANNEFRTQGWPVLCTCSMMHLNFPGQISTDRRFACVIEFFVPYILCCVVLCSVLCSCSAWQCHALCRVVPCSCRAVSCFAVCVLLIVQVAARSLLIYSDFEIDTEETRAGGEFRVQVCC